MLTTLTHIGAMKDTLLRGVTGDKVGDNMNILCKYSYFVIMCAQKF